MELCVERDCKERSPSIQRPNRGRWKDLIGDFYENACEKDRAAVLKRPAVRIV